MNEDVCSINELILVAMVCILLLTLQCRGDVVASGK